MENNSIGIHGSITIGYYLKTFSLLKKLNLRDNNLGCDGIQYIAQGLATCN